PDNRVLWMLMNLESQMETLSANTDLALDSEVKFMAAASDLADRELVLTISWAKQVPGFSSLSLVDQMMLLQHSWLEILMLSLVFRSCPYKGHICYAEDLQVAEDVVDTLKIPAELDSLTRKLCRKFTHMNVSKEEFVLLKAITLCNIVLRKPKLPKFLVFRNSKSHESMKFSLCSLTQVMVSEGSHSVGRPPCVSQCVTDRLPAIITIKLAYITE
ncbi:estrogen-related receptor gamma, partial [Aplysia californica]|uniref:Estrogen-related receptor gamma n=1 Tax=Aplysia californica TaxID=6500 RepID=A0ABM1AD80_APLCA